MEARVSGSTGPYQIIGGFNPQSWSQIGGYQLTPNVSDRTAFIFNLTTTDRRDQQVADGDGQYQTFYQLNYGPTFGGGHDIFTDATLSIGHIISLSYCANPASPCPFSSGYLNLLGLPNGSPNNQTVIEIGSIEVFAIVDTPIPAALPLFATGLGLMGLLGWRRKRVAPNTAQA
jgi:hypothetical protein